MSQRITYTIVVCYDFAKEWLDKSRAERKAFETTHVAPILMKYEGRLRRRAFDAESFTTEFSDFLLIETDDLPAYYFLIEELRQSPLFTKGLASIKKIFMGIEDGFHTFERVHEVGAYAREAGADGTAAMTDFSDTLPATPHTAPHATPEGAPHAALA